MPGVLLIETMAQTSGWLVIALHQFTRMPFLAAAQGGEAAHLRDARPGALAVGQARARRLGLRGDRGRDPLRRQARLQRRDHLPPGRFPEPEFRASMEKMAATHRVPDGGARPWLTRAREAWITGIGIVSCLGEGPDAHWQGSERTHAAAPTPTTFAPYIVHPLAPLDFDKQIPKKGDQRQMEPWQRIGTYAAGLALDDAGVKGNAELLARMDMIVAAGGGERDVAVDAAILTGSAKAADPGRLPQRAADERPAPDAVPGAALQPARRQHLDRARRHRLVAHLHGRGSGRRRRGAHRARAHQGRARATSRWSAARTTASAGTCCCSTSSAATCCEDTFAPVWEREPRRRHGARLARRVPGAGIARACARRAAPSRSRGCQRVHVRPHQAASPATSTAALGAHVGRARRRAAAAAASP